MAKVFPQPRADSGEKLVPVLCITPTFPPSLEKKGIQGFATVSAIVDEKGDVVRVKVVEATREEFAAEAAKAMSGWKFAPRPSGLVQIVQKFEFFF